MRLMLARLRANAIAAAIFDSFRCSWPRDVTGSEHWFGASKRGCEQILLIFPDGQKGTIKITKTPSQSVRSSVQAEPETHPGVRGGCHRYPDCAIRASGPGPLAIGPFSRSIEEERRVQVLVRDNNVEQALKVLKKKMQREGVFREMKLRGHYEKPSERRVREKAEAIRRARKLARKKLQREGLLPMKPRVVPGAPGKGGPARAPRL
jgi:small subunit ribosomal protein S21